MSKPLHQVRSCEWCDGLYDISLSDAPSDKKYCSAECELEHLGENPPPSRDDLADEYYEAHSA